NIFCRGRDCSPVQLGSERGGDGEGRRRTRDRSVTVWEVSMRGLQLLLVPVIGALSACSTSEVLVAHAVDLVPARHTIPEEELLDVGVAVFDPGVPAGRISKDVLEELLEEGTF